jgi:hypothetical protein
MATPTCVQHVFYDQSNGASSAPNTFKYRIPNATLAGNLITFGLVMPSTATVSSVLSKNGAGTTIDTFGAATDSETDTTNHATLAIFDVPNSAGGATEIWITFSGIVTGAGGFFQEWYNVATSSIEDGTTAKNFNVGAGGAGTASIASGAGLTTTLTGDLIQHFGWDSGDGSSTPTGDTTDGITHIVPAANYTLLQADFHHGMFCQYQIQGTAGATNPGCSVTSSIGNSGWISITRALKAAASGTAPAASTCRIFGMQHWSLSGTTTGSHTYSRQMPTTGNTFVITASDPVSSIALTGVSGPTSGTWQVPSASGGLPSVAYKTGGSPSSTEVLTFTVNDATGHGYITGGMYDIVNGGAFDQIVQQVTSTTFGPGNSTPSINLTPGVAQGIVIGVAGINTGPPDAMSTPVGAQFLSGNFSGMGDLDSTDNGDLHVAYQYSGSAAQVWVFHNTVSTNGFGIALISIASAGAAPFAAPGMIPRLTFVMP